MAVEDIKLAAWGKSAPVAAACALEYALKLSGPWSLLFSQKKFHKRVMSRSVVLRLTGPVCSNA